MRSRRTQHRGTNKKKRPRSKKKKPQVQQPIYTHPRYGSIPRIPRQVDIGGGRMHTYLDWDPDYQPPLPRGAVRGDIRKQVYCCDVPHYYYVDIDRTCVQCGVAFVFEASEQKFWYEGLQFNFASTAIRCRDCRRKRRSDKALGRALENAVVAVREDPANATALLQLAESTVAYAERFGSGDLDRAIGAARRVSKKHPELLEALYWEGRCHAAAGRRGKAKQAMRAFLRSAETKKRLRTLVRRAEDFLGT